MQVLRKWWAKARLEGVLSFPRTKLFYARRLRFPELAERLASRQPELRPYEGLAELWDAYAGQFPADYTAFLTRMARRRRVKLNSALDLACGTGTLTARLALNIPEVVGLDLSEPMLAKARERCSSLSQVRFFQGDFRNFHLRQQFDIVVCAFNSLNYVGNVAELHAVFRCAAEHLRPDGLFVFDTITNRGAKRLSGLYFHVRTNKGRFVIHWYHDRSNRKEESIVATSMGVEIHRRISIDPNDVEKAASGSGLIVDDYFSSTLIPGRWYIGTSCFFVLRKE
jgi:SAM-dependent methyltransferase